MIGQWLFLSQSSQGSCGMKGWGCVSVQLSQELFLCFQGIPAHFQAVQHPLPWVWESSWESSWEILGLCCTTNHLQSSLQAEVAQRTSGLC